MLCRFYRNIRKKLHDKRIWFKQNRRRKEILEYIEKADISNIEKTELKEFFSARNFEMIPYLFREEYDPNMVYIEYDKEVGMYYVLWEQKKMYWKRNVPIEKIKEAVNNLLIEQDLRSPHCYMFKHQKNTNGKIVADLGAAEGCFALSLVESAKFLYLFETDVEWIDALEQTFKPWKEKVMIVNKYVSNSNEGENITLDKFYKDKEIDYIKADIEGAESDMLLGGRDTLRYKVQEVEVCAYHNMEDEKKIIIQLRDAGYKCASSKGFIFFDVKDKPVEHCFRRGVIQGRKQ